MLRRLKRKDTEYMLEWMHDEEISRNFLVSFECFTEKHVVEFIANSFTDEHKHFAVVNEQDEYQGTVSLKNISLINKNAEYAIVFRKHCLGGGLAQKATTELLKYAFEILKLEKVYLNVAECNKRAIRFYEKMNFQFEGKFRNHLLINGRLQSLYWYSILKKEFVL